MVTQQAIAKTLDVPTDTAWQAIRTIEGLDRGFPIIDRCHVDGWGVGARHSMRLRGGVMVDLIEAAEDAQRRLFYLRTVSPFPVSPDRGSVEVFESYDDLAVVTWTIDFESRP